jgi:broad specificity phosphatase PhoE
MPQKEYIAYVLHHGTTTFNESGLYTGWINVELDDQGVLDAEKAAEFLSSCHIEAVYSSPLCRALRTAEIVVSKMGGRCIVERHELLPWSIPEFWGTGKEDFEEGLKPYVDNPSKRPKWGETLEEFRERIADFFEDKLSVHCPTLFVTHTSNIIALKESLTGEASSEKVVGPGGLIGIYEDGDGWGFDILLGKKIDADYGA